MNRLPLAKRAQILNLLVEGNSLRAASRIADVSINTVYKLAIDAGEACSAYQDQAFRNLPCQAAPTRRDLELRLHQAAQRHAREERAGGSWRRLDVGCDLCRHKAGTVLARRRSERCRRRLNLSAISRGGWQTESRSRADGHRAYLEAIEEGFGADVDYAQLIKLYGEVPHPAGRYSPAQIQGTKIFCCTGNPDPRPYLDELRRTAEPHNAYVQCADLRD